MRHAFTEEITPEWGEPWAGPGEDDETRFRDHILCYNYEIVLPNRNGHFPGIGHVGECEYLLRRNDNDLQLNAIFLNGKLVSAASLLPPNLTSDIEQLLTMMIDVATFRMENA